MESNYWITSNIQPQNSKKSTFANQSSTCKYQEEKVRTPQSQTWPLPKSVNSVLHDGPGKWGVRGLLATMRAGEIRWWVMTWQTGGWLMPPYGPSWSYFYGPRLIISTPDVHTLPHSNNPNEGPQNLVPGILDPSSMTQSPFWRTVHTP